MLEQRPLARLVGDETRHTTSPSPSLACRSSNPLPTRIPCLWRRAPASCTGCCCAKTPENSAVSRRHWYDNHLHTHSTLFLCFASCLSSPASPLPNNLSPTACVARLAFSRSNGEAGPTLAKGGAVPTSRRPGSSKQWLCWTCVCWRTVSAAGATADLGRRRARRAADVGGRRLAQTRRRPRRSPQRRQSPDRTANRPAVGVPAEFVCAAVARSSRHPRDGAPTLPPKQLTEHQARRRRSCKAAHLHAPDLCASSVHGSAVCCSVAESSAFAPAATSTSSASAASDAPTPARQHTGTSSSWACGGSRPGGAAGGVALPAVSAGAADNPGLALCPPGQRRQHGLGPGRGAAPRPLSLGPRPATARD